MSTVVLNIVSTFVFSGDWDHIREKNTCKCEQKKEMHTIIRKHQNITFDVNIVALPNN